VTRVGIRRLMLAFRRRRDAAKSEQDVGVGLGEPDPRAGLERAAVADQPAILDL
jgi:hypothetical protein